MKKMMMMLTALVMMTVSAHAMSYEQARQQALFLTDKMAYELNLTEEQYEAAYEVNLDYLMSVNTQDDLYGAYWNQRNTDLSYILFDWQFRLFCDAAYFYRPLYWSAGYWHFGIYARYPHRDFFYYGRPHFWTVYRGGHSWHHNGGHSWYHGRSFGHNAGPNHFGMRDGYKHGDYRHGFDNRRGGNSHSGHRGGTYNNGGSNNRGGSYNNGGSTNGGSRFGGTRQSSTRTTAPATTAPRTSTTPTTTAPSSGTRRSLGSSSSPSHSFTPSSTTRSMSTGSRSMSSGSRSSFGGSRSSSMSSGSRSMSSGSRSSSSHFGRR